MNASVVKEYFSKLNPFISPSKPDSIAAEPRSSAVAEAGRRRARAEERQEKAVSVFADDLVIEGSLVSDSDIIVRGHVHGDVTSKGNVEVRGCVEGNVCGKNVSAFQAQVTGNITAQENLCVQDSVINGDLFSVSADINSVVTGNIATEGILVIKRSSRIRGNITAVSVSVEKDAVLEGKVTVQQK